MYPISQREQSVSDPQNSIVDPRCARRRLLKGSFAVPAALTLASGTAFAAASSAARCLANNAQAPNIPAPGGSDILIRVQAFTDPTATGADVYAFVKGSDVAAKLGTSSGTLQVKDRNNVSLASGNVLCVVGDTRPSGSQIHIKNTVYPTPASSASTSAFYAILVDANGNITGISTVSTVAGGAVSNACWQSFGGFV